MLEAKEAITKWLAERGLGKEKINYKLRTWYSQDSYWGEPIPIIHCEKCGYVPVPYDQLPVTLPDIENYQQSDSGESPLVNIPEWVNTTCQNAMEGKRKPIQCLSGQVLPGTSSNTPTHTMTRR